MQFPDTSVIYNSPNFVINDPIYKKSTSVYFGTQQQGPFFIPRLSKEGGGDCGDYKKLSVRPSATTL